MPTSHNDQKPAGRLRAAAAERLTLTTVDSEAGGERVVSLAFVHGEAGPVVAAEAASEWHRDLLAHPLVSVEIGAETFEAVAVPSEDGTTVALQTSEADHPKEVENLADKLLEVHAWLRSQLRHVRAEAEAHFATAAVQEGPGEAPKPGLGLQLRQHCLAFCQTLEFHHIGEDHMFPAIEEHHPQLSEAIGRLRAEHRTVARLQEGLVSMLADIGSADPEAFIAELDRMSEELTAHLDYEEEALIPALAEVPFPPAGPSQGS